MNDETTSEGSAPPPGGSVKDGARGTGPALESHYRFLLWLVPAVERFPRSRKFLLGDRIQRTALDVLDAFIDATCTRQRDHHLARANLGLEKLRFLFRLAHDLRALDSRRYEHAARGAWTRPDVARTSFPTGSYTMPASSSSREAPCENTTGLIRADHDTA